MKTLFCLAILPTLVSALSTEAKEESDGSHISSALAAIGMLTYAIAGIVHWIHFFRNRQNRYALTLCIGMSVMVLGFLLRLLYANGDEGVGFGMTVLPLLAPCAFLAINYMLLTRVAKALKAQAALFIRVGFVVHLFIWSDIVSFVSLLAGEVMVAIGGTESAIGHAIAIGGLVLQVVSYSLFCTLLISFRKQVPRMFPHIEEQVNRFSWRSFRFWSNQPITDYQFLLTLMGITSIGILIRCVFRVIEFAVGFTGYIATHEVFFYLFDALPLLLSMSLYSIFWPPRFVQGSRSIGSSEYLRNLQHKASDQIMEESKIDRHEYVSARGR
ncbi:hypothetical protein JCM5350_003201 [Sporobolomyces pararoseus]